MAYWYTVTLKLSSRFVKGSVPQIQVILVKAPHLQHLAHRVILTGPRSRQTALVEHQPRIDQVQRQALGPRGFPHRADDPQLPRQSVQTGQHPVTGTHLQLFLPAAALRPAPAAHGHRAQLRLRILAERLDQFDELGR
ncbi:MAG: hypothetical protein BWX44_01711 [Spirochaetes bacterium ADurb.Bin001]|nr:MAG: hypothetical protein BWX44_01711 [Spirochaetes bacterium ADurb.Bin001]